MRLVLPDAEGDPREFELTPINCDNSEPERVAVRVRNNKNGKLLGVVLDFDALVRAVVAYGTVHGLDLTLES